MKKITQVECNTCKEMVNTEDASEYGYYYEVWQCDSCSELTEILSDEGLTATERENIRPNRISKTERKKIREIEHKRILDKHEIERKHRMGL